MEKLLNILNLRSEKSAKTQEVLENDETLDKVKDNKNGEVIPGRLFEHYEQVLFRPKDILNQMK